MTNYMLCFCRDGTPGEPFVMLVLFPSWQRRYVSVWKLQLFNQHLQLPPLPQQFLTRVLFPPFVGHCCYFVLDLFSAPKAAQHWIIICRHFCIHFTQNALLLSLNTWILFQCYLHAFFFIFGVFASIFCVCMSTQQSSRTTPAAAPGHKRTTKSSRGTKNRLVYQPCTLEGTTHKAKPLKWWTSQIFCKLRLKSHISYIFKYFPQFLPWKSF